MFPSPPNPWRRQPQNPSGKVTRIQIMMVQSNNTDDTNKLGGGEGRDVLNLKSFYFYYKILVFSTKETEQNKTGRMPTIAHVDGKKTKVIICVLERMHN